MNLANNGSLPVQIETSATLRVLFFSTARLAVGGAEIQIPCLHFLDENGLWIELLSAYPELTKLRPQLRLARNGEFVRGGEIFKPGDEVAVIPPVSGG